MPADRGIRALFLLPVASQPRFGKRIRGIQAAGAEAKALYFERRYFRGKDLPCPARCLGVVGHGAYIARGWRTFSAIEIVRNEVRKSHLVYAFGMDMTLLALLSGASKAAKLVYEVGDLRAIQLSGRPMGHFVRRLERWLLHSVDKIVVTAPGFGTEYYTRRLGVKSEQIRLIENRIDLSASDRPWPRIHDGTGPIVIGYFGLLRCPYSWATMKALARAGGAAIKVVTRGYPMGIDIAQEAARFPNMEYAGEFRSPDDLHAMYMDVDLVWGCYPAPGTAVAGNWKWARTNRFYESCYFRRPLVALAGTDEGREVEARNIGTTIDVMAPEQAAEALLERLPRELPRWQVAAAALPDAMCVQGDEHERLVRELGHGVAS